MTDQTTDTKASTITLGWIVTVTTPTGHTDTIDCNDVLDALNRATNLNRARPGCAEVGYRDVEYGPWTTDMHGDEFGTEYRWPDGHVEVEPRRSRESADSSARLRNYTKDGATGRTVSRRVRHGQWHPFTAADTPAPARAKRPTPGIGWWLHGWTLWLGVLLVVLALVVDTHPAAGVGLVVVGWLLGCWHFLRKLDALTRTRP